jgi:N-methylhydantoinase A
MTDKKAAGKNNRTPLRIGIDIGGTFTDFVIYDPETGSLQTFKLLSTPQDPAQAVLTGLEQIRAGKDIDRPWEIVHGSTVATNALLERKGARTAFITTYGFRDLLQIGRQTRPSLFDLHGSLPEPLVPEELRFEIEERVSAEGEVLIALDDRKVEDLISQLPCDPPVESAAITLLFSFLKPEHEAVIAARLRAAGYFVSASSEILPEYREFERASTTAVNAYVTPVLDRYLAVLERALDDSDEGGRVSLRVMQSNGGGISLDEARRSGVRCILSGPAGGLVASRYLAQAAAGGDQEQERVITFDMGGTSTDVALIDGEPQVSTEAVVGGIPIGVPMLDIHTIGAGGGSLARVDAGGALRVGPESAGADPGPACYSRGGQEATVTDANLVLGRLAPEYFLGGEMKLDIQAAWVALEQLGRQMNRSPVEAALGVIEVANTHMERALRVISVERGHDPREFTLLSFGGAGGLHAVDLARRMGIRSVLAPPIASTFSAFGMLAADAVRDYTRTVMLPGAASPGVLVHAFEPLVAQGMQEMAGEGFSRSEIMVSRTMDVRYRGQSFELNVPFSDHGVEDFHAAHLRLYGYERPDAPVEIVNLRVKLTGPVERPLLHSADGEIGNAPIPTTLWMVMFSTGEKQVPLYPAGRLGPGTQIPGPALIVRPDTTLLLDSLALLKVDKLGNMWVDIDYAN